MTTKIKGGNITTAHAVYIAWRDDERYPGQFIFPVLTEDDWGDRAVVVKVEDINKALVLLTVAPDGTDTLEQVEAVKSVEYAVEEQEK